MAEQILSYGFLIAALAVVVGLWNPNIHEVAIPALLAAARAFSVRARD